MHFSSSFSAIGAPESGFIGKNEQRIRHVQSNAAPQSGPTSGATIPGRTSRPEPDSVSVPASLPSLPDPALESPSMQAALKAAEEVRASLLAQGITPTMSAIDAAKLMALLGD